MFEYLPDLRSELEEDELQKLESWEEQTLNDTISFINFIDIALVQENGVVKFMLPNFSDTVYATVTSVVHGEDSSFVWRGNIDCYQGTVMLISEEDNIYGYIVYQNNNYSIRTLREGYTILISKELSGNGDGVGEYEDPILPDEISDPIIDYIHCESTILVLYTPQAAVEGDPSAIANIAIEDINEALRNSEIGHRVELIGPILLEGFVESGNIAFDRGKLKNDLTVQSLRDQHSADVVILLTGDAYIHLGIAFLSQAGNADYGYAIAEITSPEMRHTIPHEWAHLLSASHVHGHVFGNNYRTIMAPTPLDESRILYYSNPDVTYNDFFTGVEEIDGNASRMTSLGCIVSRYRQSGQPCESFMAWIDYELVYQDDALFYEFCAISSECFTRPDKVIWEYSYDGFNWEEEELEDSEDCLYIQVGVQPLRMVSLTYNCGGCVDVATFLLEYECLQTSSDKSGSGLVVDNKPKGGYDIEIIPNPCSDFAIITLRSELFVHGIVNYSVVDVQGKVMESGAVNEVKASTYLELAVDSYENGVYYLLISSGKENYHEKFVVQK